MKPDDIKVVSELGKEIGTTIHRLEEVLLARNVITPEDTKYVSGAMSKEDWINEVNKSPMDLFMELLSGASEHNPFPDDKSDKESSDEG